MKETPKAQPSAENPEFKQEGIEAVVKRAEAILAELKPFDGQVVDRQTIDRLEELSAELTNEVKPKLPFYEKAKLGLFHPHDEMMAANDNRESVRVVA